MPPAGVLPLLCELCVWQTTVVQGDVEPDVALVPAIAWRLLVCVKIALPGPVACPGTDALILLDIEQDVGPPFAAFSFWTIGPDADAVDVNV